MAMDGARLRLHGGVRQLTDKAVGQCGQSSHPVWGRQAANVGSLAAMAEADAGTATPAAMATAPAVGKATQQFTVRGTPVLPGAASKTATTTSATRALKVVTPSQSTAAAPAPAAT